MIYDVTVIGGGTSGIMAAISAAEHGANTLLIEKGNKLGSKLMISGGGRCNVTNRLPEDELIAHLPGNGKFLYSALSVFNNNDIIDFFENMGVALKEEDHGRMFPVSNSAKEVVDTLANKLNELNVTIKMASPVIDVAFADAQHTLTLQSGEQVSTRALVIAVGGKSVPHTGSTGDGYAWAKQVGHTITPLYPTEVALTSNEPFIQNKSLQGLSLRDVALTVLNKRGRPIVTHQMDMVFTHFGVSGPAVLRCSQYVVKELMKGRDSVLLTLDVLPELTEAQLVDDIFDLIDEHSRKTFKNVLRGIVPERLLTYILTKNKVDDDMRAGNISRETVQAIVTDIKQFTFTVHGSLSIEKAFVTGGGVAINEIIPRTMGSKLTERLFFCGEILDIHGYTGGYNITAALVTGRVAGLHAAEAAE